MIGNQRKELREALCDAFSIAEFDIVLADIGQQRERIIAGSVGLVEIVHKAIGAAEREAWLRELITSAVESNPDNTRLRQFVQNYPELLAREAALPSRRADAPVGADAAGDGPPPDWRVQIRMVKVPTSIYHLLKHEDNPLFTCEVRNNGRARNVKITAHIAEYSVESVNNEWLEADEAHTFSHLPHFIPRAINDLTEISPASLNVKLDDLTGDKPLGQKTFDLLLYPRSTVFLEVRDDVTKEWRDMTPYIGTFVTPNAGAVQRFIRDAAGEIEGKQFVGYQGGPARVLPQVRALYEAFRKSDIAYNSFVDAFASELGVTMQRVQLPRHSLEYKLANCIDGQVLFASALEGIGLSAALIYMLASGSGHAMVGWETERGNSDWQYLDTTKISSETFEPACISANRLAKAFEEAAQEINDPRMFRRWPLAQLRNELNIFPME